MILRCLALAAFAAAPAFARQAADLCVAAAHAASRETGVPVDILLALTLTETGRGTADGGAEPWAWALNQAGDGQWYESREDALTALDRILAEGTTNVDIGCFQLNYRWHGEAFASLDDIIDPMANAAYAARLVLSHYAQSEDWMAAAAAYHSSTPEHAERYLARFEPIYLALTEAPIPVGRGADEPVARHNGFPLLVPGAASGAGSLVPLDGGLGPLIGGS